MPVRGGECGDIRSQSRICGYEWGFLSGKDQSCIETFGPMRRQRRRSLAHLDKTLELIAVHDVHDVFTLLHLLDQLQQDASEEDDNPEKSDTMGLLVIDYVVTLLAPAQLPRAHHQGHTVMTMVAVMLKAIASERKAAVLYTNHTVADNSSSGDFNSVGNYGLAKNITNNKIRHREKQQVV